MRSAFKERYSYEWGIGWMLLSAAFLSLSFLFLKINLFYLNYFFILFLRFFIPFLLIVFLVTFRSEWKGILFSANLWLQLARAGCVLVAQYGITFYLTQNTLLNATVLLNASPLFIPLIEWAFLGHPPGKSTIVGALLAFLGVILVLQPDLSVFDAMSIIGLIAALGQAGSQVLYGLKPRSENLLGSLFYLFFFTSLVSFFVLIFNDFELPKKEGLSNWIVLSLFFMGASTLLNQYFRGLAYRCGRPSTLATFLYFSVFVSALFDWLFFKHTPTTISVIGSSLIILGGILKVFLRARILKKKQKK